MPGWVVVALMVAGFVLEATGIVLVALDLLGAGRRAQELLRENKLVQVPALVRDRSMGGPTVLSDGEPAPRPPPPTFEQQLDELIRGVEALETGRVRDVRGVFETIGNQVAELKRNLFDQSEQTRALLGATVGADLRRRWIGVGLLLAGLTLATAANLFALAS